MSDGIELKAGIKAQNIAQNPDLPIEPAELPHNYSTANGSENGAVYLELNLRNNRGRERQQDLLTTFSVESPIEPTSFSDENSTEPISFLHENSNRPSFYRSNSAHLKGYEENSTEPLVFGANHSNENGYGIDSGGGNSSNNVPDRRELPLKDFVDLVTKNRDFAEFRDQPREFRRNVRRFSESNNIEIGDEDFSNAFDDSVEIFAREDSRLNFFDRKDKVKFLDHPKDFDEFFNRIKDKSKDFDEQFEQVKDRPKVFELRQDAPKTVDENGLVTPKTLDKSFERDESPEVSKYEKLVSEMHEKKLSPDKFAETLPPKEREIFKARYRLDVTFGAETTAKNNLTPDQAGQFCVGENVVDNNLQTAAPPEEIHTFSLENTATLTNREIAAGTEIVVPFSGNTFADSESKIIELNNLKFQDKSSQVAVGNNTNPVLTDSGTARTVNHYATSENSSNVNAVTRRDGGAAMGGALISGAFTSIENYKNAESGQIGGSHSIGNADVYGRSVFSAGATGVMMSAAIGSVIPNSDASVGGVLGFISSVVVGVEAEQGLRWLGGDRPATVVLLNQLDNAVAPNFQPLLA